MNCIDVICGIIIENKKVLVAQRNELMSLPLKWEFPGGKQLGNESREDCLQRELLEELNIQVKVKKYFISNKHSYEKFEINLMAYFAEIEAGKIINYEHKSVCWLSKNELIKLDWAPADIPIVKKLLKTSYL